MLKAYSLLSYRVNRGRRRSAIPIAAQVIWSQAVNIKIDDSQFWLSYIIRWRRGAWITSRAAIKLNAPFATVRMESLPNELGALIAGVGYIHALNAPATGEPFDEVGDVANTQGKVMRRPGQAPVFDEG